MGEDSEQYSADEIFIIRLLHLLDVYSTRQKEILRLAQYAEERSTEIDNAKRQAHEYVSQQIGGDEVDGTALDQLYELLQEVDRLSEEADDDLSKEENREVILAALAEVGRTLPQGLLTTYIEGIARATSAPPAVDMLRSSLLVSLVGELEMMVNQLARACFERQPGALDKTGKTFTWANLKGFDSIDDVRDAVVDHTVEDALRGSLVDWIEYFRKRFDVKNVSAAESYEAQEIIQRRHCIVHNAGQVSSQYLEKLAEFKVNKRVNDRLMVSVEYLDEAADTLFLVGYSLIWAVGFQMCRDLEAREPLESALTNRVYFLLQERRYGLVMRIGSHAPYTRLKDSSAFVFQVNVWLAYKLSGAFEQVRNEIEQFNVATRSRNFNLAKLALLDRHKEAYELAQQMIRDDQLRPEFLYTWPLLSGAREYGMSIASGEKS